MSSFRPAILAIAAIACCFACWLLIRSEPADGFHGDVARPMSGSQQSDARPGGEDRSTPGLRSPVTTASEPRADGHAGSGQDSGGTSPDPLADTAAYLRQRLRELEKAPRPTGSLTTEQILRSRPFADHAEDLTPDQRRELDAILARDEAAIVAATREAMRENSAAFRRAVDRGQYVAQEREPHVVVGSSDLESAVKTRLGLPDEGFHGMYFSADAAAGSRAQLLLYVTQRDEPMLFQQFERVKAMNRRRMMAVWELFQRLPK